ncbi:MAG: hypothetical protein LBF83_08445 [Spirochaetaceae bacterium]|nr:hypothetical protein [Spirochaetaceae bacterium]
MRGAKFGRHGGNGGNFCPLDSGVKRLNTEQIDEHLKKQQPDEIVSIGDRTT